MNYKTQMKWRRFNRKPFVTYTLLGITALMFLFQEFLGGSTNTFVLVRLGAKVNELIVLGDWYRLLTPMFLHIGLSHLLFNGLVIYFLGIQLESVFGHWRFFLLYVLSALAGNATSFAFNTSISAGASTALFGLFGSTIVLGKLFPGQPQIRAMSKNFSLLIVMNLLFGLFSPGIDMAGHIGGLVGGFMISYALSAPGTWRRDKKQQAIYAVGYLVLIIVLFVIGVTRYVPLSVLF